MDVDLLRPGTVPLSPDTVLWFEFLLSKDLLLSHLQKETPNPSPTDLIFKFTSVVFESSDNEIQMDIENGDIKEEDDIPKYSLKHLALKILSLKVAAFIKWNFDTLKSLPFKFQLNLMRDLLYFTDNQTIIDVQNMPPYENVSLLSQPYRFSLVLYHQWVVKTGVHHVFNSQMKNFMNLELICVEENVIRSMEHIEKSLTFLKDALTWEEIPPLLTFDSFVMLKEGNTEIVNNWSKSIPLSKGEFRAQIAYDLAVFNFFKENYVIATDHFNLCMQNLNSQFNASGFLSVNLEELHGYIAACNKTIEGTPSLLQQLHISVVNQYMGVLNILQQDNISRDIPILYRINLELDIHGAMSSGKFTVARDLLTKIQALNAVRCILDKVSVCTYEITSSNLEAFIWAVTPILQHNNLENTQTIKAFINQSMAGQKTQEALNELKSNDVVAELFNEVSNNYVCKDVKIPSLLYESQTVFLPKTLNNKRLELRILEQEIITSYNLQELRQLVLKITSKGLKRPIWKINPCWELPIPLQSVLVSMASGFLQDFGFILLAKSRELMLSKNWDLSLEFLNVLKVEVQAGSGNLITKLNLLINWEVLLVQMNQLLEEWPSSTIDKKQLAEECQSCLQTAESVLPRTEIMEHCALCLISLGHWEFLANFEKRWSYFEIAATISSACQDLVRYKGNKKLSRDLWDLVLPVFSTSPMQSKRSSSGNSTVIHRDSPTSNLKSQLMTFFLKLRDSTILTVVISMLARLYNVLRDESNLELSVDYIMLWPAVVSNSNSYNSTAVLEVLTELLRKALKYYPTNVTWMRLTGDINFVNGCFEESLNSYLKSIMIVTENLSLTFRNDDHVIRRMIKCCSALNCHTQAAILCQFLEDPDYTFAFHSLSEQKLCADSVDGYYHCFWDTSMIEYLVNHHQKRSEFQRRKCAVQVMSLLELNSNNNEEIQHEASNLRKIVFLSALCKQYVH